MTTSQFVTFTLLYYLGFIIAAVIAIAKKPKHISPWFAAPLSWAFVAMAIIALLKR